MNKTYITPTLLAFIFLLSLKGFSQNLDIITKQELITVQGDSSYIKEISVIFNKSDQDIFYPIFYDTELENISNIEVSTKKGKKYKAEKHQYIVEENVDLDFITSTKVKSVLIPKETDAKLTYQIKGRELLYLSKFSFFTYDDIDTLKYEITVPKSFEFANNIVYKDKLNYFSFDSIQNNDATKWTIETTPYKVAPDPFMDFGIYKDMEAPLMRTILIPASYKNNERKYMNDWYLKNTAGRRGLKPVVTQKINELTKDTTNPNEITEILYNYVKTNFKYVAIEIGMGAFIPTHVNEVYETKQGDCKDLSNFLCEILKLKGIHSTIALASTYHHITDCDFPSLSSANHVICVVYLDGKTILLDPTDPIHQPRTPVESLQDRSIFIMNDNGGEFYKVNGFSAHENIVSYEIDLMNSPIDKQLNGRFHVAYEGISGNFLKRVFYDANISDIETFGKQHYESLFATPLISDFSVTDNKQQLQAEGTLTIKDKIIVDGEHKYLFLDFLPRLFETENRNSLLEGTHLGSPFKKVVNLKIKMDAPFQHFTPIEHSLSKNGVSFHLKISTPEEGIIECQYAFLFNHIFANNENLDIVNDILNSFKKITNEPIIITNKPL